MYHEALGHTVSFADLVQRSRSGDKSLGGIPPLDIRSADLHCPTCLLRRAQAILEQNKKKHAFKDKGGAEGVAYWESKLRSQQATKLTASHEGGGAGFRPAGQKLDAQQAGIKDSFSATMLSPTHTEQGSELLGIDLSIWSGLVRRCKESGNRAPAEMIQCLVFSTQLTCALLSAGNDLLHPGAAWATETDCLSHGTEEITRFVVKLSLTEFASATVVQFRALCAQLTA